MSFVNELNSEQKKQKRMTGTTDRQDPKTQRVRLVVPHGRVQRLSLHRGLHIEDIQEMTEEGCTEEANDRKSKRRAAVTCDEAPYKR